MLTHDEVIHAIEQEIPGVKHGRDFFVGHPIGPDGKQSGPPSLHLWRSDLPRPNIAEMTRLYEQKHHVSFKAMRAREKRDYLLSQTDWTDGRSISDEVHKKFAGYRQALRDITNQPEFPVKIDWPVKPD